MKQSPFHTEPSYDNCSITDEGTVLASTIVTEEVRDADDGDLSDWEYFTFKYDDDPDESIPMASVANSNDSTIPTTTMTTTSAMTYLLSSSATQTTKIMDTNHTTTTTIMGTEQWNAQMEPVTGQVMYATATASVANTAWYSSQHQTVPMLLANSCHHMDPYSSSTVPQPELLTPNHHGVDLTSVNGGSTRNEASLCINGAAMTEPTVQSWRIMNTTACAIHAGWFIPQQPQITPMPRPGCTEIVPLPLPPHDENDMSSRTNASNGGSCGRALVYNPIGGGNGGHLCSNANVPNQHIFSRCEAGPLASSTMRVDLDNTTVNSPLANGDWTALNGTTASLPLRVFDGGYIVFQNPTTVSNVVNHDQAEMASKTSDISSTSSQKDSSNMVECNRYYKLRQNVSVQKAAVAPTVATITTNMSSPLGSTCAASSLSGEATTYCGAAIPVTITTTTGGAQLLSNNGPLCRPLMLYNYFFRDERDNILSGMKKRGDPLPPPVSDFSPSKLERLLHQRWFVDPMQKRRHHRKSHGKIDFSR